MAHRQIGPSVLKKVLLGNGFVAQIICPVKLECEGVPMTDVALPLTGAHTQEGFHVVALILFVPKMAAAPLTKSPRISVVRQTKNPWMMGAANGGECLRIRAVLKAKSQQLMDVAWHLRCLGTSVALTN